MKRKFTYRICTGLVLLLLMLGINAKAQFPKYLSRYPVILGTGSVNTTAQKGNVIFLGGSFTSLGNKPSLYGFTFGKIGDANANFVSPNDAVVQSTSDNAGGFYIGGLFTSVGGTPRNSLAKINADGSLNTTFNPGVISTDSPVDAVQGMATVGNNLIICGYFTQIGDQAYTQPLAALDGTTGEALPGWNDLQIPSVNLLKAVVNNNKLYVLGWDQDYNNKLLMVVDITDITHPIVINSFRVDAQDSDGLPLSILDMTVSDNIIYLSGWQNLGGSFTYQSKTLSGHEFNSALFAINATTGDFIKDFTTPLSSSTDVVGALAYDLGKVYLSYSSKNGGTSTGHLAVFDAQTGADVTSSLPDITLPGSIAVGIPNDIPIAGINKLTVTSDHNLIIFGAFNRFNSAPQSLISINLTTSNVADWPVTTTAIGPAAYSGKTNVTESNGKIFIGGYISLSVANSRNGLAAINATTGALLPWKPIDFTGTMKTMAISNNTLYIGGDFASTDGSGNIENLAAYDISDPNNPTLKTDWTPNPDGIVNSLTLNETALFIGGDFLHITGQARKRIGSFDINTNTLTSWNPGADNTINALASINNVLYAGGKFLNIGTTARNYVAAFDLGANGAVTAWNPQLASTNGFAGSVNALVTQAADGANHDARIFVGGKFNAIGVDTKAINNFAVINTTDGKLDVWQLLDGFPPNPIYQEVFDLKISNNKLYAGGQSFFRSADVSGNFGQLDDANYLVEVGHENVGFANNVKSILPSGNIILLGGDFVGFGDETIKGLAAFQIGDVAPELIFSDLTKTYGDEPFSAGATSTVDTNPITYSIADGDNPDNVITLADGKITIVKPGVATVTASQNGAADVKAKITISKAELTIHPKDASSVVNQPLTDFPFTITGWKFDDETKADIYSGKPEFATTAAPSSPAGTYDITISGAGTLTSDYYSFVPSPTEKATLTINTTGSTPQVVTFAALPAKTYGDADFDGGASTDASGLKVTYSSSDESIATVVNGKIHLAGAGTVTITASQAGNPTYAPAADVMQTLTIAKAALNISADNKTKERGAANPVFTATYTTLVNGDKVSSLATAPVFSTTATATSAPGTYPITVSDAASPNYEITFTNGTLTIRSTQIITWTPVSTLTYGDTPFNPGATSDAGANLVPVYTTSNPAVIAIENGQAVIKGAGTATISATFAAANGFELTTGKEDITVLKKPLVITADSKARNYGEANPEFTFTYDGFVGNDKYNTPGVLTASPVANTTATATSPAGAYPITVNGATSNNYLITFLPGTLTISNLSRALTFNVLSAKIYGNPDFDAALLNSGEQVVYTFSNPAVATAVNGKIHIIGAGTTDVTASAPVNSNYNNVTPVTQTLTVTKAPLIITADNKSKTQGPPDIILTASYNGFVNNDTQLNLAARPILTSTATANSPTGTYPISINGASSPNYDITYQPGILTIILAVGQEDVIVNQALSPNGDGLNDYFQINGITNFPDNHVTIINRNGAKVYEASGYDNSVKKFDGHNNSGGDFLQRGTYYYLISYKVNGAEKKKSGYLILKY